MDRRLRKLYPNYLTYLAVAIFGVFFMLPVIAAFILGFTDWNIDRLYTPKFNGIGNFKYIFEDEYFVLAIKNTAIFAVLTTVFKVFFGLLLSLALNMPLKSRNFLRTIFYMPAVLSMVVVGIIFSVIFRLDGMINSIIGIFGNEAWQLDWLGNRNTALYCTIIAEVWKWSGFTMAIFIAGLQGISIDYYEAARIDGANTFQQFKHITFPLLAPAFTIAVTMNAIGGLKVFDQVYVLTAGGPGYASQVLSTYVFKTFSEGTLGRSTAMSLVLFISVVIVSLTLTNVLKKREVEA